MGKPVIKPVISPREAIECVHDGTTLMVGGFNYGGIPYSLVDALLETSVKDLTLIANDTAYDDVGHGKLVSRGKVKKVIASHVGLNKTTGRLFNEGTLELELVPQGTFVERIRAGAFGLGGFLTPTGVGTVVAEGKQVLTVDGREYILELPLKAEVAFIRAHQADRMGNLTYFGTNQNFNPAMAGAADIVIAEVDEVLTPGEFAPEAIVTPGILVDMLVIKGDSYYASRT